MPGSPESKNVALGINRWKYFSAVTCHGLYVYTVPGLLILFIQRECHNMPTQTFKIAVTGGAGLVGSAVVQQALSDGHTVVAIDLPPIGKISAQDRYTYASADLTDFDAFLASAKGCDAVIHLAALYNRPGQEIPEHVSFVFSIILESRIDWFWYDVGQMVHNKNTAMSYNALCVAVKLKIDRVVLASSINSIGMRELIQRWRYCTVSVGLRIDPSSILPTPSF